MKIIYLSLSSQLAVGTFFMKSPVAEGNNYYAIHISCTKQLLYLSALLKLRESADIYQLVSTQNVNGVFWFISFIIWMIVMPRIRCVVKKCPEIKYKNSFSWTLIPLYHNALNGLNPLKGLKPPKGGF